MLKGTRIFAGLAALLLNLGFTPAALSEETSHLAWNNSQTVDARINDLPMEKLLGRLASVTGWRIYAEPGLAGSVNVSFKNLPQGQALRLLLGDLNYALVPEGDKPAKLYVYRQSLGAATSLITAERPKSWIANEIILAVDPEADLNVEKLAAELGGKVVAKSEELNAYRLQFESNEEAQKAREKLANREDIDAQDNFAFDRPTMEVTSTVSPTALFPIDPAPVTAGQLIKIALVDTPIQPLDGKMKDFILPSINVGTTPVALPETPTHATSMAQTILNSLAFSGADHPENLGTVRIQPVDIYGGAESTTTFEVAQGLYQAIQTNPNVINLSLGGTGNNPMVEYLLQMARQKDILVFASAGNTPTTSLTWPAASPNVIGVTAATYNGEIAPYANRGDFVDVKAPGTSRVFYNGQRYVSTGTSTATAFISGNAAARLSNGQTPQATATGILQTYNVKNPALPAAPRR